MPDTLPFHTVGSREVANVPFSMLVEGMVTPEGVILEVSESSDQLPFTPESWFRTPQGRVPATEWVTVLARVDDLVLALIRRQVASQGLETYKERIANEGENTNDTP